MDNNVFSRIEKKFWMDKDQYLKLTERLSDKLEGDEYGLHRIYSLYYDTDDYYLIRRSIERPDFKEKLRIRSYEGLDDNSQVFIELKKKLEGVGYKRRTKVSYKKAVEILTGKRKSSNIIEREIVHFQNRYKTRPKVLLSYDREAYHLKDDKDIRITFDRNLCYQPYEKMDLHKEGEKIKGTNDRYLMEIKADGAIPVWLTKVLSDLNIYQSSYSKIGDCYLKHLVKKEK